MSYIEGFKGLCAVNKDITGKRAYEFADMSIAHAPKQLSHIIEVEGLCVVNKDITSNRAYEFADMGTVHTLEQFVTEGSVNY